MTFNVLNRKIHYWASAIVAVPLLVIIVTGLLLQAKKHSTWVQPPERRGTGKVPVLSYSLQPVAAKDGIHDHTFLLCFGAGLGVLNVTLQKIFIARNKDHFIIIRSTIPA